MIEFKSNVPLQGLLLQSPRSQTGNLIFLADFIIPKAIMHSTNSNRGCEKRRSGRSGRESHQRSNYGAESKPRSHERNDGQTRSFFASVCLKQKAILLTSEAFRFLSSSQDDPVEDY